jgi:hypothetical protein
MDSGLGIVAEWFAQTVASYSAPTARFLACEDDPFRNPVGHTMRRAMAVLVAELQGDMNTDRIRGALHSILQIRAVQDFTPDQACDFILLLGPILLAQESARPAEMESRIDQFAQMAFEEYLKCRERIAEVRVHERRRAMRPRA